MTINKFAVFAKTLFLSALLVAIVAMAGIRVAFAADGDLDQAFAVTGKTLTDFQYGGSIGSSVVVQPDGKAVVSGLVYNENYESIWGIARYNVDGTLDQTFGTGGKATVDFKAYYTWKIDMKLQSDGKIVLGGSVLANPQYDFGMARLNSNGTLDQTFGNGGTVTFDVSAAGLGAGYGDGIMGIAIQNDGKIVACGYVPGQSGFFDFGVIRVNPNGTIDNTFGTAGMTVVDFQDKEDLGNDVAIQADGKIVVGGTASTPTYQRDFAAIRLNTDGTLDQTFGIGGKVTIDFLSLDEGNAVAVQSDGKIILGGVAGADSVATSDFGLARLNLDGSLDQTFGTGGRTTINFLDGIDQIFDILLQPDGKIVAAGSVTSDISDVERFVDYGIARYLPSGALDSTFGIGGKMHTDFGGADYGQGIALGPDCKLVASGYSWDLVYGGDLHYGVARYNSSGCPVDPPTTGNKCPRTQGYWKNHPEAWPVSSVVIGSQSYTKAELLVILGTTTQTDASITLARQLIAAKLNIANGSDSTPVSSVIASSDALLATYTGKLPFKVKSSSANGQLMTSYATTLNSYNTGLLTPNCQP